MTYRAHIKNGQITLDQPANLPEGTLLKVEVLQQPSPQIGRAKLEAFEPIKLPGGPLSDELIRNRR